MCRARHERERNRTRERALLSLQQVVEATEQQLPAPNRRMRCVQLLSAVLQDRFISFI